MTALVLILFDDSDLRHLALLGASLQFVNQTGRLVDRNLTVLGLVIEELLDFELKIGVDEPRLAQLAGIILCPVGDSEGRPADGGPAESGRLRQIFLDRQEAVGYVER